MQKALATYRRGSLDFDRSVDWPDGTRVEVLPLENLVGMDESEWPTTAEGIAALVQRMEEREPLELTEAEIDAWEAALRDDRATQKELMRQSWQNEEKLP